MTKKKTKDYNKVDPPHYKNVGDIQVWDVMELFDLGRLESLALRHLLRAGKKSDMDKRTDVEKCIRYMKRLLDEIDGNTYAGAARSKNNGSS